MSTKIFNAVDNVDIIKKFYEKTQIKLNYMVSYFYLKGQVLDLREWKDKMIKELYLDSGAFSGFKSGSKISLYQYMLYLKLYSSLFDEYFNLDDKFDNIEHNYHNQTYLENELDIGKKPIPVIHEKDIKSKKGEIQQKTIDEIERYVKLGHDYIAIGSPGKNLTPETYDKITETWPNLKIHMFGNLSPEMLETFKPYSADSAFFLHHSTFGSIYFMDSDNEKHNIYCGGRDKDLPEDTKHLNDFINSHDQKDELFKNEFLKLLQDLEIPIDGLVYDYGEHNKRILNLYYMYMLEQKLQEDDQVQDDLDKHNV